MDMHDLIMLALASLLPLFIFGNWIIECIHDAIEARELDKQFLIRNNVTRLANGQYRCNKTGRFVAARNLK